MFRSQGPAAESATTRPPAGETPRDAAARIAKVFGSGPRLCVLGARALQNPDSEKILKLFAKMLGDRVGEDAVLITGGLEGVQQVFAQACPKRVQLFNVIPTDRESSDYGCGRDIFAGGSTEERVSVSNLLGDVYFTVEGGGGVSAEAWAAMERGADVVPLIRSGGASSGLFGFPPDALQRPEWASEEQWQHLKDPAVPVYQCAATCADLVARLLQQWQQEPWTRGLRTRPRQRVHKPQDEDFVFCGAPAPVGAPDMKCASTRELRTAFAMLDEDGDKRLTWPQARRWLRCAGWVKPDEELDKMLSSAHAKDASDRADEGLFTRKDMMDVSSASSRQGNYSMERFELDVKLLAQNGAMITKESLIECILLDPTSDLGMDDIGHALELLGLGDTEAFNVVDLSAALLCGVCNPPGVFDIAKARDRPRKPGLRGAGSPR